MNPEIRTWALIGLAVHLWVAYISSGFYGHDEHFQIMEVLGYWLADRDPTHADICYKTELRPMSQVLIYGLILKPFIWLGIDNPFTWATIIRILSGLLGWFASYLFALCALEWIKTPRYQKLAAALCFVLWCVPYLHARTSSESFAGSAFCIAIALMTLKSGTRILALSGFLMGAALQFRYHMFFPIMGYLTWLWFIKREPRRNVAIGVGGASLAIVLGFIADRILYGHWVFGPWSYYYQSFVVGIMRHYGESAPFWVMIRQGFESLPPLSTALMALTFVGWWKFPKHVLTWVSAALFLGHSLFFYTIIRYLFPLILVACVLPVMVIEHYDWARMRALRALALLCMVVNIGGLIYVGSKSARRTTPFYEYVYEQSPEKFTYYTLGGRDPYNDGFRIQVYAPREIDRIVIRSIDELRGKGRVWYLDSDNRGDPGNGCALKYENLPNWLYTVNVGDWISRSRILRLYECEI